MIAVVRVRGTVNVRRDVAETLSRLRLEKPNHCIVLPEDKSYIGMVKKVKDWVAYGRIDLDTLKLLLERRGRLTGGRPLTEENVKELGFNSIEELAEALWRGEVKIKDLRKLKPVFRLHPPSGGYRKTVKKHYPEGSVGDWGGEIGSLIKRMV